MDLKEKELVDQVFLDNPLTLNCILGGRAVNTGGFVIAKVTGETEYNLVAIDVFNKGGYETANKGVVQVLDSNGKVQRISCEEYASGNYSTPSTGYVSVYFIQEGNKSGRVLLSDFDPTLHKKVFGGIVAIKDGTKQYVTKEDIDSGVATSLTKGSVTATIVATGETKHVPAEEFNTNRHLYKHNTEGTATGKHIVTGKKKTFNTSDITDAIKLEYSFSTKGNQTVYEIATHSFINIPLGTFNMSLHMSPKSLKFKCIAEDGEEHFEYFGTSKDFFRQYNVPQSFWDTAKKGGTWSTNRTKGSQYNNCTFQLLDWKPGR